MRKKKLPEKHLNGFGNLGNGRTFSISLKFDRTVSFYWLLLLTTAIL